jgi:DNA mismatch endonuclease (patch repair protein)
MDRLSRERRSANMAAIRGRDTGPELAVRSVLRALGVRYRLHGRGLPGRPDIVLRSRGKVILVHGCFWHRHPGCRFAYSPKSREEFWQRKFAGTVERDARATQALARDGWSVLVVWECETADMAALKERITLFLGRGIDAQGGRQRAQTVNDTKKTRSLGEGRTATGA